ncbi:MAG: HPF/RaiA family ribosome-associated protein [Methyloceanibacter sp.]|jgi:ribosomal subunit interface protein|nr:HPF/RaiA family ribosome-associated protein [Methyloceanibacter sp.]
MPIPLQISFRNMDPSPAVEERIRQKAAKLERFNDRIMGCTVVVEAPHHHHHKGKLYNVRIEISVPGKDIVVDHAKPIDHAHEDVYVAIRDAFDAATRRLEDQARKMRGSVKSHTTPPHGKIASLFGDYGFIATADGDEVYFNRNSVVGANFDALEVGNEVSLVVAEDEGVEGLQASTVKPVGKHHIVE